MNQQTKEVFAGIARQIILAKGAIKATELVVEMMSKYYDTYGTPGEDDVSIDEIFLKVLEDPNIKEHQYKLFDIPYREKTIFCYWPHSEDNNNA